MITLILRDAGYTHLAAFNSSSGCSEPLDQTKIVSTNHSEGDREEMAIRKPKTG